MTQMQEEQQIDSFRFTEENGVPRGRLRLKALQMTIILKPKPAKQLNYHRRHEHEAQQEPEPHEISMFVELLRHPQIRAHVKQKCAHADHSKNQIKPGIRRGKSRALHDGMSS